MAVNAWPFDNADTTEDQYRTLFRALKGPGVAASADSTALKVTATGGLGLTVAPGVGVAEGMVVENTAPLALTAPAATPGARVDRIVAQWTPSANTATIVPLAGTSGSNTPPALTRNPTGVFQAPLARFTVPAGGGNIDPASIIDERPWIGRDVGVWTTDTRPGGLANPTPPWAWQLGRNMTLGRWEYWDGTAWIALGGRVPIVTEGGVGVGVISQGIISQQVNPGRPWQATIDVTLRVELTASANYVVILREAPPGLLDNPGSPTDLSHHFFQTVGGTARLRGFFASPTGAARDFGVYVQRESATGGVAQIPAGRPVNRMEIMVEPYASSVG